MAMNKQLIKPRNALQTPAVVPQSSVNTVSKQLTKRLSPSRALGRTVGLEIPLQEAIDLERDRFFRRALSRAAKRSAYDADWGETIVSQDLADDPGPINSGTFYPVDRWMVLFRSIEAGQDGTQNITISDVRTAINSQTASSLNNFIIKEFHIWLAPKTVSTHFSGVLYTKDDQENGILGGQYSDIAPYGEFVKFKVRFPGEGIVSSTTDAGTKQVLGLGGSEKWNGIVYTRIVLYN